MAILAFALILGACATNRTEKEEFTVDLKSPQVFMGEIEAQINKAFPMPGIKKITVTMNYFPREDAVCLQYKSDFMTYYQCWSRSGREAFINALENYKTDYTERTLKNKGGRRAMKKYGVVEGYLIWQMYRYMVRAESIVNLEMGYAFKNKSPYFMINQREGAYMEPKSERDLRTTEQIPMYFTRAQADKVVAFFDQQYLWGLVSSGIPASVGMEAEVEAEYEEEEIEEIEEEIDGDVEGY